MCSCLALPACIIDCSCLLLMLCPPCQLREWRAGGELPSKALHLLESLLEEACRAEVRSQRQSVGTSPSPSSTATQGSAPFRRSRALFRLAVHVGGASLSLSFLARAPFSCSFHSCIPVVSTQAAEEADLSLEGTEKLPVRFQRVLLLGRMMLSRDTFQCVLFSLPPSFLHEAGAR